MTGEYILFYQGRIAGGIYDDIFPVKLAETAKRMMPNASNELSYEV